MTAMKKKRIRRNTPDFKRAYKEAMRTAAKTPGFPSKDRILVDIRGA